MLALIFPDNSLAGGAIRLDKKSAVRQFVSVGLKTEDVRDIALEQLISPFALAGINYRPKIGEVANVGLLAEVRFPPTQLISDERAAAQVVDRR